jgi:hypothetical protein
VALLVAVVSEQEAVPLSRQECSLTGSQISSPACGVVGDSVYVRRVLVLRGADAHLGSRVTVTKQQAAMLLSRPAGDRGERHRCEQAKGRLRYDADGHGPAPW